MPVGWRGSAEVSGGGGDGADGDGSLFLSQAPLWRPSALAEYPPAPRGFLEAFYGRAWQVLPGDTAVSPAVSCRCPLVETGKISEKIRVCCAGCRHWEPVRGTQTGACPLVQAFGH